MAPEKGYQIPGDFSVHSGAEAGRRILSLKRRPTAVFCFNDEMALGVLHQLKSAGVAVPQEISVAGFDDIEFARFAAPPLRTMGQPMQKMGETAMSALIDLLRAGKLNSRERYSRPSSW
jgi:LacI family repressor for deo operon, udp, cdd, tsx, nupC, and nupG